MLRSGTLPHLPQVEPKREDAIAWFEQHPGRDREASPTAIKLLDYAGPEVRLTKRAPERHLAQKYLNEGRHEIRERVPDVLANPDEVYLLRTEHKQGQHVWQVGYFKHFQNGPLFVPVHTPSDELLLSLANGSNLPAEEIEAKRVEARIQISTWYTLAGKKADQTRQGILLHKKR